MCYLKIPRSFSSTSRLLTIEKRKEKIKMLQNMPVNNPQAISISSTTQHKDKNAIRILGLKCLRPALLANP